MSERFCEHLGDYGALYAQAEEAYRRCNELVDTILAAGADSGIVEELGSKLEDWLQKDRELKQALVDLAVAGRIRIPRKKPYAKKRRGQPICAECGFRIPRLQTSEWHFAGNGVPAYRGEELPPAGVDAQAGSGPEKIPV